MSSKQEILEAVAGLKILAIDVKKVLADGKVDLNDLAVLQDLMNQHAELVKAFEGLGSIKTSELTLSDALEIFQELGKAGAEVAAA